MNIDEIELPAEEAVGSPPAAHAITRQDVQELLPLLFVLATLVAVYFPLVAGLPKLWGSDDGYFSHGFLVPIISGYIVYLHRDSLRLDTAKPAVWAIIPLALITWVGVASTKVEFNTGSSFCFLASTSLAILTVAGWRILKHLLVPIWYLLFGLPVWQIVVDGYTQPLQFASTSAAFQMLHAIGLRPLRGDGASSTTIYLNNFTLDVGVPCSGLKLVIALMAFCAFFISIAKLRVWANLVLVAILIPLCIIMNGLRIALIGLVGDTYGEAAGHTFHDYSGYITLCICFWVLFKITRLLGWEK